MNAVERSLRTRGKLGFAAEIVCIGAAASLLLCAPAAAGTSSIAAQSDGERRVNEGYILADRMYAKTAIVALPGGSGQEEKSLVLYGMGTPPDAQGRQAAGVSLINRGRIEIHLRDMRAAADGADYARIMGQGLTAGSGAMLRNQGEIRIFVDQGAPYEKEAFEHGMLAGADSVLINDGRIDVSGAGSDGTNLRGMTSDADRVVIINNGVIALQAADSFMARALTTVGKGVELTNNGTIQVDSDSVVFGIAQSGGSATVNHGLIEVRSQGVLPLRAYDVLLQLSPMAYGMNVYGTVAEGTVLENTGVIRASQAQNDNGYRSFAMAVTTSAPYELLQVRNTGIAAAANGYELGVNTMPLFYENGATPASLCVRPVVWATALRDFSGNLFALGHNATLDFTDAKLVLRPSAGYRQGEAYGVGRGDLVDAFDASQIADIANPGSGAPGVVTGFEALEFAAEMPDFLRVDLTADRGRASLSLSGNRAAAQDILRTAVLGSVDFARQGVERLDEALQAAPPPVKDAAGGWETFFVPYYGRLARDRGLTLKSRGFVGGVQRQADDATCVGGHFGYGRGDGSGGAYEGAGDFHAALAGAHVRRTFSDGSYWRGRLGGYFGGGAVQYGFASPYGAYLRGSGDNAASGVYGAVFYGKEQRFQTAGRRTAEIGVSSLYLHLSPEVRWRLLQQELPGYHMDADDAYRAVFAHAAARWEKERPAARGAGLAYLGLGLRVKLAGDEIGMRMIGAPVPGEVAEDQIALTVSAGYTWKREDAWSASLAYAGAISSDVRAHEIQASLSRNF